MRHASAVIDLSEEFLQRFPREELSQLYWPIDLHFKPAGYKVWAQIIAEAIEPLVAARVESLPPATPNERFSFQALIAGEDASR